MSFAAPTDPLSDTTQNTLVIEPGEFIPPELIASWIVEHGERFDLRRLYANGTAGDKLEIIYFIADVQG